MPNEFLPSSDYDQVRQAIDVSLSKSDLPDKTIEMSIYKDAAIAWILKRVSDALEEEDEEKVERLKRAAVYVCAAYLCPAVVRVTSLSVQSRDLNYSRQTFDPEKRAAELLQKAEEEIGVVEDEETPNRPIMFTRARGRRGRW